MTGRIYFDAKSDPSNPGWVASANGETWQLDDGTEDALVAEATKSSEFYCNRTVSEWKVTPREDA